MMTIEELDFANASSAGAALSWNIAQVLRAGLDNRGCASLIVSGGKGPIAFFQALSAETIDWPRVVVSLADERWVAPDSADSNERLVREHLLQGPARAARFVPLKNEAATPQAGLDYARKSYSGLPRPFDALVLGMGEDGHTASLFPGWPGLSAALDTESTERLVAVDPPSAPHARMSFTLAAILESRRLYVQIAGERKRAVYERARDTTTPAEELPIAAVLRQTQLPVQVYRVT